MHQPTVIDAVILRGYRQDLPVSKFLSGLSPTLRSQVRSQILGGDDILTLSATFSRVMRVSTDPMFNLHHLFSRSAMIFSRDRGCGCDFGG